MSYFRLELSFIHFTDMILTVFAFYVLLNWAVSKLIALCSSVMACIEDNKRIHHTKPEREVFALENLLT